MMAEIRWFRFWTLFMTWGHLWTLPSGCCPSSVSSTDQENQTLSLERDGESRKTTERDERVHRCCAAFQWEEKWRVLYRDKTSRRLLLVKENKQMKMFMCHLSKKTTLNNQSVCVLLWFTCWTRKLPKKVKEHQKKTPSIPSYHHGR